MVRRTRTRGYCRPDSTRLPRSTPSLLLRLLRLIRFEQRHFVCVGRTTVSVLLFTPHQMNWLPWPSPAVDSPTSRRFFHGPGSPDGPYETARNFRGSRAPSGGIVPSSLATSIVLPRRFWSKGQLADRRSDPPLFAERVEYACHAIDIRLVRGPSCLARNSIAVRNASGGHPPAPLACAPAPDNA